MTLQKQKGVALIVALIMLSMITLVAGVLLRNSAQQEKVTYSNTTVAHAQFAAELALREAINRITLPETDPNFLPRPPITNLGVFATGSKDSSTESPPGSYKYSYTIEYKKLNNVIAFDNRGRPIFLVKAEGQSNNARRRVEIAIVDTFERSPFGFGLTGCQGVWLDSNTIVRSLNSKFDTYPLDPIGKDALFGNAGNILTLENVSVVDGKKRRGNIDIGGRVFGNVVSAGTVNLYGGTVRGYINADGQITIDGNSQVAGNVYTPIPVVGTSQVIGQLVYSERPIYQIQEECDELEGKGVYRVVQDKIVQLQNNNNNNEIDNRYVRNGVLTATGTRQAPVVINLGAPGTTKSYSLSGLNIGDHVTINVRGTVNLTLTGDLTMMSSTAALNILTDASLRVYSHGAVYLDKTPFNYADNGALPTSLIIYTSVSDGETVPSVSNAKVQLASPNTIFRGLVYAPNAFVRFKSNNAMYGAIRGKWIRMESNTQFTYDQAAADIDAARRGYRLLYWNEPSYDSYE